MQVDKRFFGAGSQTEVWHRDGGGLDGLCQNFTAQPAIYQRRCFSLPILLLSTKAYNRERNSITFPLSCLAFMRRHSDLIWTAHKQFKWAPSLLFQTLVYVLYKRYTYRIHSTTVGSAKKKEEIQSFLFFSTLCVDDAVCRQTSFSCSIERT